MAYRRIAAYKIIGDNKVLSPGVIEIVGKEVVAVYPLQQELANTEWFHHTIKLHRQLDGTLYATLHNTILTQD